MTSVQPTDAEVAAAIARTGYVYADPVDHPRVTGITADGPDQDLAVPPPTWGLEPTPRDQAAIDAGNA
jgi:hypothetical protein